MERKKIKMLGLAETRWKGKGRKSLHHEFELIYSGGEENTHYGVGFILEPTIAQFVEEIRYINDRILSITININNKNLSFIHQVYAPQQGRSSEEKHNFCDKLQDTIDLLQADSEYTIMGDLNGHVGRERFVEVVGAFGIGRLGRTSRLTKT